MKDFKITTFKEFFEETERMQGRAASGHEPVVMKHITMLKLVFAEVGIPYTVRQRGEYEYLFIGGAEDAECLTGPNDNFETTDLDALNCRHKFFEFENGELVSWSAS